MFLLSPSQGERSYNREASFVSIGLHQRPILSNTLQKDSQDQACTSRQFGRNAYVWWLHTEEMHCWPGRLYLQSLPWSSVFYTVKNLFYLASLHCPLNLVIREEKYYVTICATCYTIRHASLQPLMRRWSFTKKGFSKLWRLMLSWCSSVLFDEGILILEVK